MDFTEFIQFLDSVDFGVLNFNTYRHNGKTFFYLCVAERGDYGKFIKVEAPIEQLPKVLDDLKERISNLRFIVQRWCINHSWRW